MADHQLFQDHSENFEMGFSNWNEGFRSGPAPGPSLVNIVTTTHVTQFSHSFVVEYYQWKRARWDKLWRSWPDPCARMGKSTIDHSHHL